MRLIDAADARRNMIALATGFHSELVPIDAVLITLQNAPTVDAVEVVRCKDCIYNENGCCINSESYDDTRYRPDYFCADGERRNDERL